ncbi:cell division protein FtsB [Teredinibacter sp. KSP-S5-2]|uniref:cell division protein FtsB n=1 Tax=Teredinibacter sp. KSP-S5-2 TaxID=3034506 RepID=UPI002934E792|nr:cell division protein FtsB [Teredinibacter sp. KSP-S5-2]WNO10349.1 cell division protein FtsB [Teredinibacter sp. KSP-S5-2]
MKWLTAVLILIIAFLQYRLWIGDGSLAHVTRLKTEIRKQREENARLVERNRLLAAEVDALKNGLDAVEERARTQMGMIKEGETFYMIVDKEKNQGKK